VSEATTADPPVTIAEFDAFLEAQQDDALWELVGGRIVAMTNSTEEHEQIAGNIGAPLKLAMDPRGCRAYQGGIRVQRSENSLGQNKPRPDIFVSCGASGRRNYVTDPLVVVEVLSPSTIDVDRGDKLRFYKGLPTLRHIVLVYQDQMRIEHYRRTDEGWSSETLTQSDDILHFEAVGFQIDIERVYFGVEPTNVHRLSR
jgi:Uma2 family endonuclease